MERKYYLRGLGIGIAVTAIIMGIALSDDKTMTDEEIIARAKELGMVENTVLSDMDDDGEAEEDNQNDERGSGEDAAGEGTMKEEGSVQPQDTMRQEVSEQLQDDAEAGQDGDSAEAGKTDGGNATNDVKTADDAKPADNDKAVDSAGDTDQAKPADPVADHKAENTEQAAKEDVKNDSQRESANEIITSATVKTITVSSGDGSYTVARKLADVGVVTSAETFDTFLCQHGYDKRLRTGTFSIPADASDEQIARIVTGAE